MTEQLPNEHAGALPSHRDGAQSAPHGGDAVPPGGVAKKHTPAAQSGSNWWVVALTLAVMVALSCGVCGVTGGLAVWVVSRAEPSNMSASPTPLVSTPVGYQIADAETPVPARALDTPQPKLVLAQDTLGHLQAAIVPEKDVDYLARAYNKYPDVRRIVSEGAPNAATYEVGTKQMFWVQDTDTKTFAQHEAELAAKSDCALLWVDTTVPYQREDAQALLNEFCQHIYPTVTGVFGHEALPGVDNDPHVYILFTRGTGSGVAGYFSSVDTYPVTLFAHSNQHEMFFLNAGYLKLTGEYTYGVLAHEFQHMIHWAHDRTEALWVNEGASELSAFISGYGSSEFVMAYVFDPNEVQLNYWPVDEDEATNVAAHYGASFLFVSFLYSQYGEDAIRALVSEPADGMTGVQHVLEQIGSPYDADQFFFNWEIGNYFGMRVKDLPPQYAYHLSEDDFHMIDVLRFSQMQCGVGAGAVRGDAHQYAAAVMQLDGCGGRSVVLEMPPAVPTTGGRIVDGHYAAWSVPADYADEYMQRDFDLTGVPSATLHYKVWYDTEKDYDYAFVSVSTDGVHWDTMYAPHTTADNPTGSNLGWGYTGESGQWLDETLDLSLYAGQHVWVRFEYITDMAVHGDGVMVDAVSIPEIGYATSFEDGCVDWDMRGFICSSNMVPQKVMVGVVTVSPDWTTLEVSRQYVCDGCGRMLVDIPQHDGFTFLVIAPVARYTAQTMPYTAYPR